MKIRALTLSIVLLSMVGPLRAQTQTTADTETDFAPRFGVGVGHRLGDRWKIGLDEELRLKDNASTVDRIYSTLSVNYKATKWLKISPEYSLINIWQDGKSSSDNQKYWETRHRFGVSFTGSVKSGRWEFSLREKFQLTLRTDSLNPKEKVRRAFDLRSRVMAQYSFHSVPLKPYALIEVTNTLNTPDAFDGKTDKNSQSIHYKLNNYISKLRYSVGVEYRLSHRSSMDVFYRLDTGRDYDIHITINQGYLKSVTKEPFCNHIVGVFYNYSF